MRVRTQLFIGIALGLGGCVWLTLTEPRTRADVSATPLFTPIPTESVPTPTPVKPEVAGKTTVKILTFGVSLEVHEPIADLVYGEIKEGENTWAGFTTKKLVAKYPDCKAGALGVLVRTVASPTPSPSPSKSPKSSSSPSPTSTKTPINAPFKKTVGGYTYSYRPSYSTCVDTQAGRNELAAARAAIKNAALPTLSN